MTDGGIKITGAKELRKVLRDMAERSPREMQWANFVTADMVADRIKARMRMAFRAWPRGNRRHPTVPLPDSVVAKATTARAIVEAGGPKSPHFHPHNFGGTIARFHSQARTK